MLFKNKKQEGAFPRSEDHIPPFITEVGRICQPMNTVADTFRKPKSEFVRFIGNSFVPSSSSDSKKVVEAVSLTEIGSSSFGKEAAEQYFSIVRIMTRD